VSAIINPFSFLISYSYFLFSPLALRFFFKKVFKRLYASKKNNFIGYFFLGFTINQFAQKLITNPRWLHGFWTANGLLIP